MDAARHEPAIREDQTSSVPADCYLDVRERINANPIRTAGLRWRGTGDPRGLIPVFRSVATQHPSSSWTPQGSLRFSVTTFRMLSHTAAKTLSNLSSRQRTSKLPSARPQTRLLAHSLNPRHRYT